VCYSRSVSLGAPDRRHKKIWCIEGNKASEFLSIAVDNDCFYHISFVSRQLTGINLSNFIYHSQVELDELVMISLFRDDSFFTEWGYQSVFDNLMFHYKRLAVSCDDQSCIILYYAELTKTYYQGTGSI
jgi:hypothetical protein